MRESDNYRELSLSRVGSCKNEDVDELRLAMIKCLLDEGHEELPVDSELFKVRNHPTVHGYKVVSLYVKE